MTKILGKEFINEITNKSFPIHELKSRNYSKNISLKLIKNFDKQRINLSRAKILGGIEKNGQTISLENAPYPLPLRYITQYKKLIRLDKEINFSPLLIFESNYISKSKMKILQIKNIEHLDSEIIKLYRLNKEEQKGKQMNK